MSLEFLTVLPNQLADQADAIFRRFSDATGVAVQGTYTGWNSIWQELVQTGIYKRGPDLAEPGSTWLESLVEMNVLRPFTKTEIDRLGGETAFIPSSWKGVVYGKEEQVWGIPSRVDPRVIYYWKDMLEEARLNPEESFSSLGQFPAAFEKLRKVVETPWVTATSPNDPATIQTLSSWVWDVDGAFVSPNGKQVAFMEPAALDAIVAYFDLHRFMPRRSDVSGLSVSEIFIQRKVAAVIGGSWVWTNLQNAGIPPDMMAKIGILPVPAPGFLGGMNLVVFHHTRQEENAVHFIEYLSKPQVQMAYAPLVGLLPSRLAAWEMEPYSSDPILQTMYQSIQRSRSFPMIPLWGTVESRMIKAIGLIWNDLLAGETANTRQIVQKHLSPLASRLNFALDR